MLHTRVTFLENNNFPAILITNSVGFGDEKLLTYVYAGKFQIVFVMLAGHSPAVKNMPYKMLTELQNRDWSLAKWISQALSCAATTP